MVKRESDNISALEDNIRHLIEGEGGSCRG